MPAWLRAHPGAWGVLVLVLGALIGLWWLGNRDVESQPSGPIPHLPTRTPATEPTAVAQESTPLLPTATVTPAPTDSPVPSDTQVPSDTPVPPTATPSLTPTVVLLTPVAGLPCGLFPADNIWNRQIRDLPVHPQSAAYIKSIGGDAVLHPDFGAGQWQGGPIGIPVTVARLGAKLVPLHFTAYGDESDPGPYPVPTNAPVEGGPAAKGDRHVIVVDSATCTDYELYHAQPRRDGSWNAGSAARWPLTSNALRPAGWSSADAAGLPILPGLVRYDEVASGTIRHAIRFTTANIQETYVWPAGHSDGTSTDPNVPPMGVRLRLNPDLDLSGFDPKTQVILRALQDYGMILADTGDRLNISGAPDSRWNDDLLLTMEAIHASDFEVVDTSGLMIDPASAASR
jgi:hypothetical protein